MTSETLKNPSVPTITDPVGIDAAIQRVQIALGQLAWLQKSFGRAWPIQNTVLKEKRIEPMVYQGGKEYYTVLPNDALNSYSFFRVNNSRSTQEYQANVNAGNYLFKDPVDVIFWCDLKAIDPTKDYVYKEELIREVLNVLNRDSNVEVVRIWDDKVDDIYKGYTLEPGHRDLLLYPYTAFRIEIFLRYTIQCGGFPVIPVPPNTPSILQQILKIETGMTSELKTVKSNGLDSPLRLSTEAIGTREFDDLDEALQDLYSAIEAIEGGDLQEQIDAINTELVEVYSELDLKLNAADYVDRYKGRHPSLIALGIAHPTGSSGDYAVIDAGIGDPARQALWDEDVNEWVLGSDITPATTDQIPEGGTNLYHTSSRVRNVILTGLDLAAGAAITALDSVISALGKLQKQITDVKAQTINGVAFNGNINIRHSLSFLTPLVPGTVIAPVVAQDPAINNLSLNANTLRAYPWIVTERITINNLRVHKTAAQVGLLLRVGVYSDNGSKYPNALLTSVEFDFGSSGGTKNINISDLVLQPGLYWVASCPNANTVASPGDYRSFSVGAIPPVLGMNSGFNVNGMNNTGYGLATGVYALPSIFPSGAQVQGNAAPLAVGFTIV